LGVTFQSTPTRLLNPKMKNFCLRLCLDLLPNKLTQVQVTQILKSEIIFLNFFPGQFLSLQMIHLLLLTKILSQTIYNKAKQICFFLRSVEVVKFILKKEIQEYFFLQESAVTLLGTLVNLNFFQSTYFLFWIKLENLNQLKMTLNRLT